MINILVLYYSVHGSTQNLARSIATGIEQAGVEARLRTVAPLTVQATGELIESDHGLRDPLITKQDLQQCAGLAMGAPTRFGQMPAALKYFWDSTSSEWLQGVLVDKPACVFTSSSSLHGGQEATLLSMMVPLLHHGMLLQGIPYTEPHLHRTQTGGTPYGASHVAGVQQRSALSTDEKQLAMALGKRLASTASALATAQPTSETNSL